MESATEIQKIAESKAGEQTRFCADIGVRQCLVHSIHIGTYISMRISQIRVKNLCLKRKQNNK